MRIRSQFRTVNNFSPIPAGILLVILSAAIVVYSRKSESSVVLNSEEVEIVDEATNSLPQPFKAESDATSQMVDSVSPDTLEDVGLDEKEGLEKSPELAPEMTELLSVVTDNSFEIIKREMPAYWGLLKAAKTAGQTKLESSVKREITFNDLFRHPSKHRGELCKLEFVARKIIRHPAQESNTAGFENVYEIWGNTDESKVWLYVFITDSLPDGYDESSLLYKRVKFAGYFFKVLAYHPGAQTVSARPLAAPMLIGKIQAGRKMPERLTSDNTSWTIAIGAVVAVSILGGIWGYGRRKVRKPRTGATEWTWLEQ